MKTNAGFGPCRNFGVFTDIPALKTNLAGLDDLARLADSPALYLHRDTLTTSVSLDHHDLQLSLYCNEDAVDFHRPILVRKVKIKNLADHARMVRM